MSCAMSHTVVGETTSSLHIFHTSSTESACKYADVKKSCSFWNLIFFPDSSLERSIDFGSWVHFSLSSQIPITLESSSYWSLCIFLLLTPTCFCFTFQKMVKVCAVPGCPSGTKSAPKSPVSFHVVPSKNQELRAKWLRIIPRAE